jgi:hypothetical protein
LLPAPESLNLVPGDLGLHLINRPFFMFLGSTKEVPRIIQRYDSTSQILIDGLRKSNAIRRKFRASARLALLSL